MVSVVVVNFNRVALLEQCLRSLQRQTRPADEVLVVDNGSTDTSPSLVLELDDPRIRLIRLDSNLGFAAANNRAFQEVRGDLVALLNNDAVAHPEWLESLIRAADTFPATGMFASRILFFGTKILDKAGHLIFPDGQNRGRGTGEPDRGQYDGKPDTLFPDGCAALYRRELLEEVGGFDDDFFAYADDADLGLRALWGGWSCRYVPEARVYHHHSSSTGPLAPEKVFWIERNRVWLAVKNLPLPLLLISPVMTGYRLAWNVVAALRDRGAAGEFRRKHSLGLLAATLLRAYASALQGLPRMWRKRRSIRSSRRLSDLEFMRLLLRHRISARRLAFRGADRDLKAGMSCAILLVSVLA